MQPMNSKLKNEGYYSKLVNYEIKLTEKSQQMTIYTFSVKYFINFLKMESEAVSTKDKSEK